MQHRLHEDRLVVHNSGKTAAFGLGYKTYGRDLFWTIWKINFLPCKKNGLNEP
jgi:hypothetical protein